MSGFHNILVGVDLTRSKPYHVASLDSFGVNAIRQARWIARESRAPLTFLSALPLQEQAGSVWRLPAISATDQPPHSGPIEEAARLALIGLVGEAKDEGIDARAMLVHGEPWIEICRQVVRDNHDLLVASTHDTHGLRRLVFGSTARTLVHDCPCPVWVSKPGMDIVPRNILVASDLSALSDSAVCLGFTVARLAGAQAHLLDAVEYPLDRLRWTGDADFSTMAYHRQVRADAEQGLYAQIERCGIHSPLPATTVNIAECAGFPDHAILEFIHQHPIDLIVLGTSARHGLPGILLGNTAERLLPEVPCSILVVKPMEFHPSRML